MDDADHTAFMSFIAQNVKAGHLAGLKEAADIAEELDDLIVAHAIRDRISILEKGTE